MRSTKVIWIGVGTIIIIVAVMIAVSYYNKMTIRELRNSIELLTSSISNLSRDVANSKQQYVPQPVIQPPLQPVIQSAPPQQYYDNADYYYDDDDMYEPEPQYSANAMNMINRNNIAEINKLSTITEGKNIRIRGNQSYNGRTRYNNMQTQRRY